MAITCFNLSWLAGGPRLIFSLAHALEKLGHKVVIYAPDFDPAIFPELWRGLDIRRVKLTNPISWQYENKNLIGRIAEKFKRERALTSAAKETAAAMDDDFDMVNPHDFSYMSARFYRKKNPRVRIVWYAADPPYMYIPKQGFFSDVLSRFFNWYKDGVSRRYFHVIDRAAVLNKRNKKWAEERGISAGIVRPGADFKEFYAPVKTRRAGDKRVKLLSVGAPNKYRRFEDTILAAAILRREGYDANAIVIGKNIGKEDEYCEYLARLAKENGVESYVDLRFGGSSDEELRRAYRESDVFVLPIHLPPPRDGFGWQMVCFEAMAAGIPVVISRKNDSTEVLEDGKSAVFVDPMSPEQITAKVRTLIDDPDFYRSIASAGQKLVKEKLSWEKFAEDLLRIAGV